MTLHPFDEATALEASGPDTWRGRTSPAYGNMVGPFGGITAAQALTAVLRHPQRLGDPVAVTINFAAALEDGAFDVVARPVRTNRSTQHWTLEIRQNGHVALTGTAFTALRRDTWDGIEQTMPSAPPPAEVPLPAKGKRVEWVNRYEMRFIEGGFPEQWDGHESGSSRTRLWLREAPPRPIDFASLTALADVFFPRIWLRRATFVPIGTVSMTVYFHADAARLRQSGDGWLLGQAQGQAFHAGYFDQNAQLWAEDGTLLVTSHQVVYYKE